MEGTASLTSSTARTPDHQLDDLLRQHHFEQMQADPLRLHHHGTHPHEGEQHRVQQVLQQLVNMEVDSEGLDLLGSEVVPIHPLPDGPLHEVPPLPPQPPTTHNTTTTCNHNNTTKRGSDQHYDLVTCLDCKQVISRTPKTTTTASSSTTTPKAKSTPTTNNNKIPQWQCRHENISWRGSNGFVKRQTCLDCGRVTEVPQDDHTTTTAAPRQRPVAPNNHHSLGQLQELLRSTFLVASVRAQERPDPQVGLGELHRIIDAVSVTLPVLDQHAHEGSYASIPSTPAASARSTATPQGTPTRPGQHPRNNDKIDFGKHKGNTYWYAYQDEGYVTWAFDTVNEHSCKGLKKLTQYFRERRQQEQQQQHPPQREPQAFMATEQPTATTSNNDSPPTTSTTGSTTINDEDTFQEKDLVAILDLGCNKTCHGELWFRNYMEVTDRHEDDCPLEATDGSGFHGIGGKVTTLGRRHLEVSFELKKDGMAHGTLSSAELANSNAPLLLSIEDQRRLGLVVELRDGQPDRVYSHKLKASLVVTNANGLLGIRLLPKHVAMMGQHLNDDRSDNEDDDEPTSDPYEHEVISGDRFLEIEKENHKTLSRNQKKMVEQSTDEVRIQDQCLWSTLKGKSKSPLPKGCKVFLLEVFAGAAVLSSVVAASGYPIGTPIDIRLDGTNLQDATFRAQIEHEILEKDPYVITFSPVFGVHGAMST